ncbi:MAG: hypothetical protein H7308_18390, partial [Chthonomonadaceae bacterium]|nr:hypothetical protein [Chthonomonadaceae bacterium]
VFVIHVRDLLTNDKNETVAASAETSPSVSGISEEAKPGRWKLFGK